MKRFGRSRRARYFGGGLALVAFVALTLFVVLPAFASNSNDQVYPISTAGVTPIDIGVGGNQSCSSMFSNMPAGVQQTTDPSPPNPGSTVSWPSGDGWNFTLTSGALPGFANNPNKGGSLSVNSNSNAEILGIAIKGGTDNLSYDYRTIAPKFVTYDSLLHAPASKFTLNGIVENPVQQYFGVSQLVICYMAPVATISGTASRSDTSAGLSGLQVTLTDTKTQGVSTVKTDTSGNYSFVALPGDSYTVCVQAPTAFPNVQTTPGSDQTKGSCSQTSGNAPNGYSIASLPAGGASDNFVFQPKSSVDGTVYNDLSNPANGQYDPSPGPDQPQPNWTVTLYQNNGTQGSPIWAQAGQQTTDSNGNYNFANALTPGGDYLVCEQQPSADQTLWAQSEPTPSGTSQCSSPNLEYGYRFTAPSTNITNDDFGNMAGVNEGTCGPPPPPFGSQYTNGELSIQLAGCKPNQVFVFNYAQSSTDPNYPWVSVFAGDQTQSKVPLIEKIIFPDPIVNGAPSLQHLAYTDTFPYDPNNTKRMPYCQLDPRDPAGGPEGMALSSDLNGVDYTQDANKGLVLPNDIGTNTKATSCAISIRTYVDGQGNGWLEALVYTDIDGFAKGIG